MALVAKADLNVIAALAHAGRVNGMLRQIVETADEGGLPPIGSPHARIVETILIRAAVIALSVISLFQVPVFKG